MRVRSFIQAALLGFVAAAFHADGVVAAEKPKLSLKGFPAIGTPGTVFTFRAVLTGGVDSEALYCLSAEWEWEEQADASINEAECEPWKAGETKVERVFTEEQTFQRVGPHVVRIILRKGDKDIASAGASVTVRPSQ